jgi:ATP-dependent DNA helicase RecG
MQMAAKVPFDDRRNNEASIDVISPALVRNYLANVKSDLVSANISISEKELYRSLRITAPVNGHEVPRNIALLFFVDKPESYFPGAQIDIAQFGDEAGDLIEEKIFRGPLHAQLSQALDYLNNLSTTMVQKIPNQITANRTVAFPDQAIREALVNAVYHRSYEGVYEPIKVYLYPDRMEITSYPGPMPGIEKKHLQQGERIPDVPYRNRRIGEFLKDLRLAEARGTGIPKIRRKMADNGSPSPTFDFDEGRTYFRVTLPAHPQYVVIHALRQSAHLWITGEKQNAVSNLENALKRVPKSGSLIAQIIEYKSGMSDIYSAEKFFRDIESDITIVDRHLPFAAMAKVLVDNQQYKKASELLNKSPSPIQIDGIIELAILYKRASNFQESHKIFAENYELIKDDPKALHEFAQTKIKLSMSSASQEQSTKKKLTLEAVELLRRAVLLSSDDVRKAWCWFDIANSLNWLKSPRDEISQAFSKAIELLPNEKQFKENFSSWQSKP